MRNFPSLKNCKVRRRNEEVHRESLREKSTDRIPPPLWDQQWKNTFRIQASRRHQGKPTVWKSWVCAENSSKTFQVKRIGGKFDGRIPVEQAFIDKKGRSVSVNGSCYLQLLQDTVWPALRSTITGGCRSVHHLTDPMMPRSSCQQVSISSHQSRHFKHLACPFPGFASSASTGHHQLDWICQILCSRLQQDNPQQSGAERFEARKTVSQGKWWSLPTPAKIGIPALVIFLVNKWSGLLQRLWKVSGFCLFQSFKYFFSIFRSTANLKQHPVHGTWKCYWSVGISFCT